MTPDQERRLEALFDINQEAIRKHNIIYDLGLSEEVINEEAQRAALDQYYEEEDMRRIQTDVDNTKELTHISLCAGYGGIDIGLRKALRDVRTVCFVEIESFAQKNLVAKIEEGLLDAAPIFTDLKQFPWELFSGRVDILSGGFPCQPFSAAGRRAGDEDPRHLWPYIVRGIERLGRPPIVLFENVEGIISSKLKGQDWSDPEGTPVLLHVLRELERLGYNATAGVFSASEVGAPHQRKRVFIMGCRADLGERGRDLVSGLLERGERQSTATYPAPRGAEQYSWEPPRVNLGNTDGGEQNLVNTDNERLQRYVPSVVARRPQQTDSQTTTRSGAHGDVQRQAQSEVGRSSDGASNWLGITELYEACDNRTDELRLLGNGVVPDTAERAFRVLWRKVTEE